MAAAQKEIDAASDRFEDLSGTLNESFDNPYDALIVAAIDAPVCSCHGLTHMVHETKTVVIIDRNTTAILRTPRDA